MRLSRALSPFFSGFPFSGGPATAQETRASLSGIVSDTSGSVVPGTSLQLTNMETGVTLSTAANEAGLYRFLFLDPGKYKIVASISGFKTWERDNIQLTRRTRRPRCRWCWRSGRKREKITVTAEAPLLEAEKSDRGMLIDNKKVVDLPINTRNPIMLAALSNGIVPTSGTTLDQKPFSNSADGSWSINGGIGSTVEFLLDGAPNNTIYNGVTTVANVPSVDAVQEFRVMTSTYDAQYGHTGGGAINISLKSGTNGFHGSGYEYLKRAQFNAAAFSDNAHGNPTPASGLDQYGFTIGGPVRVPKLYNGKDKTFFFFAYEQYHEDQEYPSEKVGSVPTPAQRTGDFSNTRDNAGRLITIYDPLTGKADASGKWVRTAFPGNVIPADRINPVSKKILALYPLPNTLSAGSPALAEQLVLLGDNIANFNFKNVMARVDHNFSPKERMYARWSWSNFNQVRTANSIPGLGGDHRDGGKYSNGGVVDSVTTINSSTHFQYARSALLLDGADRPARLRVRRDAVGLAGVGGEPTDQADAAAAASLSRARRRWATRPRISPSSRRPRLSLQPNIVMIRGKQTIKAGLDYRVTRYTQYRPSADRATLNFDQGFTRSDYLNQDALSGNGMASMLLGYAQSGSAGFTANPFFQWIYTAPWVQDDIKVSRKLTLNLGLRWDITSPVTERFDRMNRDFFSTTVNPISDKINQAKFPGYKVYGGIGFVGQNGLPRSAFNSD